jgi:hypothetical protein
MIIMKNVINDKLIQLAINDWSALKIAHDLPDCAIDKLFDVIKK